MRSNEVLVFDAGAYISELQSASVKSYVLRLAANCTARRNRLPEYSGQGRRPQYGQLVRPLPRQRKGKTLAATKPDYETSFEVDGRTIRAQSWQNLVLSDLKVDLSHETFSIWVFFDPLYSDPLVLGTNLGLQPLSLFNLYLDRWPVEQVPLVAKQMLGLHRQASFCPGKLSTAAGASYVGRQYLELSGTLCCLPCRQASGTAAHKRRLGVCVGS